MHQKPNVAVGRTPKRKDQVRFPRPFHGMMWEAVFLVGWYSSHAYDVRIRTVAKRNVIHTYPGGLV